MPAPVIITIDPDRIPHRDGSQTQGVYSDNMDYFASTLPVVVDDMNDLGTWMNTTATTVQTNTDAASASATSANASKVAAEAAAAGALLAPGTSATSTSTITPATGSVSFTLAQTGKSFVVGQFVTVADSTTPNSKFFNGAITAFNSGTGAITVDGRVAAGTSGSSWVVTAAAPAQGERFVSPVQKFVALGNVSGSITIDCTSSVSLSMTLTGNTTLSFTMPSLFASDTEAEVTLEITKGGSYSLTFPAGSQWSDGTQPNPTSGTKNEYVGTKKGSANWIWAISRKNIS